MRRGCISCFFEVDGVESLDAVRLIDTFPRASRMGFPFSSSLGAPRRSMDPPRTKAVLFGLFVKDIEKSFPHFFADRSFSSIRMTLSLMRSVLVWLKWSDNS